MIKMTVIVRAARKDCRITGVDISKDKKFKIYEASTRTIQRLVNKQSLISTTSIPQQESER